MLRQLRERAGLTREQLAARLDNRVSVRTLQDWENAAREPAMTRRDWIDFCEAVGVKWEDLPENLSAPASERDLIELVSSGELASSN